MSNLNDRLVKGLLTRANARLDESLEQWEDITGLFTPSSAGSSRASYYLEKEDLHELIKNIPLRITVELFTYSASWGYPSGTIQVYITTNMAGSYFYLTNTLFSTSTNAFTGYLSTSASRITYSYGLEIPEAAVLPKILKVERLIGV